MEFESRTDAGYKLGHRLLALELEVDLVVGLPRGGVVVAAEVAEVLKRPLEVLVVRKVGHPWHREFAVGALAEEGVLILDKDSMAAVPLTTAELEAVIAEEKERLRLYCTKFRQTLVNHFAGSRVLLVDDGLATGATAEAAVRSAQQKKAREVIMAAPVASTAAYDRLSHVAGSVISLIVEDNFGAVGQYYKNFAATTDEEVLASLHRQQADYRPA